jgi:hypothetical protein
MAVLNFPRLVVGRHSIAAKPVISGHGLPSRVFIWLRTRRDWMSGIVNVVIYALSAVALLGRHVGLCTSTRVLEA